MNEVRRETVFLLLEDDPNDVFFVEREFEKGARHIRLKVVQDGQQAIRYFKGEGAYVDRTIYPIPHVILTDLKMPNVSGFEFLQWLRNESPGNFRLLPLLVMSASALAQDVKRAYELGANSYLVKPINWDAFKKLIFDLGIYWADHVVIPEMRE